MKDGYDVALIIIFASALAALLTFAIMRASVNNQNCRERGGFLIETYTGAKCLKAEELK